MPKKIKSLVAFQWLLLTLAIAIFWFGDKFTTANMVGALMVIGGLYLVSLR